MQDRTVLHYHYQASNKPGCTVSDMCNSGIHTIIHVTQIVKYRANMELQKWMRKRQDGVALSLSVKEQARMCSLRFKQIRFDIQIQTGGTNAEIA